MAQVINTNIASLNAQRNLNSSQGALNTSLQRLSSGLRINSAKDDAAGLAISDRFTSQIQGLNQAARNSNDGISLAQTAEGDLAQITTNLQRIRQLSVQSSNATNSSSDRNALQKEVGQLISEIDRVAKNSSFNNINLLDGSFTSQLFQVGANAAQTISIDKITNAQKDSLGNATFSETTAVTVSAGSSTTKASVVSGLSFVITNPPGSAITATTVNISAFTIAAGTTKVADVAKAYATAINAQLGETGIYATVTTAGALDLTSVLAGTTFSSAGVAGTFGASLGAVAASTLGDPQFLENIDITDQIGSQQALSLVDEALTQVSTARADLGAIQNRFASVVTSLQTTSENLSASRSRILDADFAEETASLTRNQILQQAGTAMLAQANTLPNNVLTLLR